VMVVLLLMVMTEWSHTGDGSRPTTSVSHRHGRRVTVMRWSGDRVETDSGSRMVNVMVMTVLGCSGGGKVEECGVVH